MMSRKDYELIASTINTYVRDVVRDAHSDPGNRFLTGEHSGAISLVNRLADALRQTNPCFDAKRFIEFCTNVK